jgi:hypothetical protein
MQYTVANHPEPIFRQAPAPWRYAPALVFVATPLAMWWSIERTADPYWTLDAVNAVAAIVFTLAACAASRGKDVDWFGASVLTFGAFSSLCLVFHQPTSHAAALLASLGAMLVWLTCALALASYAWAPLKWLRWPSLSLLIVGCAPLSLWYASALAG